WITCACFSASISKPGNRQTAIHVDHAAGRVRQVAAHQRSDDASDVFRLTPASLRREAVRDAQVVRLFVRRRHVGGDDSWTYLVNGNVMFGQPEREETSGHRRARLAHTVFAAV